MTAGLFLALPDHAQAANELRMNGRDKNAYMRFLNVTGRWATQGSAHAPLLTWPINSPNEAEDAAQKASKARGRVVKVISRESINPECGFVQPYSSARASALLGALPFTEARAIRNALEVEKLIAYACAVTRVFGNPHRDIAEIVSAKKIVLKELRQQFGGGSMTSAVAWLNGKSGLAAFELMIAGEGATDDDKAYAAVIIGLALAKSLEIGQAAAGLRLG